jgi:hypothetical protein
MILVEAALTILSCLTPLCDRCIFEIFYMERQPYILHSVFAPTWTTII